MTSERAASVVNDKEIYFMAHIKMLDMYNDIPHSYNIQKMIYDDNSTLQDVINQLNITDNDAKSYDYKDKTPTPLVKDEIIGGNQTTGVAPEPSETIKGGSMGLSLNCCRVLILIHINQL